MSLGSLVSPVLSAFSRGARLFRALLPAAVLSALCAGAAAQAPTSFSGKTAVGATSQPLQVTVTLAGSGTAATPLAVTQGVSNADFTLASAGTCTGPLAAGQQCTASVVFSPRFPGMRYGAVVVESITGTVLGEALVQGLASGPLAVLQPGVDNTVAGDGNWIYRGDGMAATSSPIFLPTGIIEDPAGNLYLSDSSNNRVRRVDAQTGTISTIAGNGSPGYSGDGGLATLAGISNPAGLVMDGAGNIFFVDSGNHCVRRIDAISHVITTVVGTGVQGYSGDGGAANAARLSLPEGVAIDLAGNLYVADTGNNVIREVDATTKVIRTVAGTGVAGYNGDGIAATSAMLNAPWGLAIGLDSTLYVADLQNNMVRHISAAGQISAVAGAPGAAGRGFAGDGSAATAALLNAPAALTFDPAGNLYIADSGNDRIRRVLALSGEIQTLSGNGEQQFVGEGLPATKSQFYGPYSIYFDQAGNLLIADMFHNRIRRLSATQLPMAFDTIRVSKTSSPQPAPLENDGNAALTIKTSTFVNAALDPATTNCTPNSLVAAGNQCNLGVEFAPMVIGDTVYGTVTANTDAPNSPATITVSGQVLSVEPTTVALTSDLNPSMFGGKVTFTATVTSDDTKRGGPVAFLDGNTTICTANLDSSGQAVCAVSTLSLGQHSVTASYAGDANNASSVSSPLIQIVKQAATVTLTASPSPVTVTNAVTLLVKVTANSGTPTGTVTFLDGASALGTATLDSTGAATLSVSTMAVGSHTLTASYAGDANDAAGTSSAVTEVVQQAVTSTTLASSNTTPTVGNSVTFTASVVTANGPAPTGTVTFADGTTSLGGVSLDSQGNAVLVTAALTPGKHAITATYAGDTDDAGSASPALQETVQQIATGTTLAASANPANAGATVSLTATVTMAAGAVADGAISGTVSFTDGSTKLGTVTVNASGQAVLSLSTLPAGAHNLVATYSGNTKYAGSASTTLSEQILVTATTTTLSSNQPNALAGKAVTFTATITSPTGIPTGSVSFRDGAAVLQVVTLNAQGIATFTTSGLNVATHTLTAVYSGDGNYTTSTSNTVQQVVSLAATTLTLAGPTAAVDAGTNVTLTTTLSGNGVTPTGALTLKDGNTVIGTQTVSAAGTFTFQTSTLALGTHNLVAVYAGDANNAAATSPAITVTVQQAPTATALASSLNPAVLGQSVVFTASVTSDNAGATGTVTFLDGTTTLGSVALGSNGVALFSTSTLTFGVHTITAVYGGDTTHAASTASAVREQIVQAATVALTSSLNPSVSGNNVVLTAKVAGVGSLVPTGQVVFHDGAAVLATVTLDGTGAAAFATTALGVGSHILSATYAGDTNYSNATGTLIQTVQNANTQIALTAGANPATYGVALPLTAAVTTNGGVATGAITFTEGTATVGTAVLDAKGVAVLTVSTLTPGTHTLVASYAGDGKAGASTSTPLTLSVKQMTTVAVASSANPAQTLSAVTLTATISNPGAAAATGTVSFADGGTQLGTAAVDGSGHATLTVGQLSSGAHAIVATYAGDAANFAATSAALTETVQLRGTTTVLTATQTNANNPLQVTLIAVVRWTGSATPTGTMVFTYGSQTVGSANLDSTGVATLTAVLSSATESLVASYSGDGAYADSASLATNISGGAATQFTMVVNPSAVTVVSKNHTVVDVTLSSVSSFADTMQMGCLGLPYAATCTFSQTSAKLNANGTMTVQLTIDTGDPLGAGASTTASVKPLLPGGLERALECALPGGMLLSLVLLRKRRRALGGLLLVFLALGAAAGMTGCAGLQINGTPAGSYTFKVTAAGQGSGVTQSQPVSLTVTE